MKDIAPKKSLGQNFLKNKTIAQRIVNLLGGIENKPVIEIGPGMGVLTEMLLQKSPNLTIIELDNRAVEYLRDKFASVKNLNIVNCDFLKFDLSNFARSFNEKIFVIGNIPYNISTEIFFQLFQNAQFIEKAVLTVQKEVAARICGKTGTKNYGITTLAAHLVAQPHIALDIAPGSFFPVPKVYSSVLVLNFFSEQKYLNIYNEIMDLIRNAFSKRRKILRNSLENYFFLNNLDVNKVEQMLLNKNLKYFSMRAEQLNLNDYLNLFQIINEVKNEQ